MKEEAGEKAEEAVEDATKKKEKKQLWPILGDGSLGTDTRSAEASYWAERTRKLSEQGVTAESQLLRGVLIWFNGRTGKYTRNHLVTMIQRHGGRVSIGPSSSVTHIIACNTTSGKAQQFLRKVMHHLRVCVG